jgi:type IV secretion system protein VirB10
MPVKEIGDPRLQALFGANDPRDGGVRPTVRLPGKGLPPIAIAVGLLVIAVLLFSVLNARRTGPGEPAVQARATDNDAAEWTAPPPLYIPPVPQPATGPVPVDQRRPQALASPLPAAAPVVRPVQSSVAPAPMPQSLPAPTPASPLAPMPQQRVSSGSALVLDTGGAQPPGSNQASSTDGGTSPSQGVTRMRASALANRSMTVPQGYLIPAVLETGFDSTKPGYARAVVSRDVRGFDGKNVLIPRGSRLIGQYQAVVAQGQNRAVITWTRLIRPDGMTINMESPAVDTLGRGGVAASVNTHFFARLGDALLQSTVGLGQVFANRAVTGPVVVLQGNAAAVASQAVAPSAAYVPTLTVPPGKSISIFVAHDLDFSAAGGAR